VICHRVTGMCSLRVHVYLKETDLAYLPILPYCQPESQSWLPNLLPVLLPVRDMFEVVGTILFVSVESIHAQLSPVVTVWVEEAGGNLPSSQSDEVWVPGDPLIRCTNVLAINLTHGLPRKLLLCHLSFLHHAQMSCRCAEVNPPKGGCTQCISNLETTIGTSRFLMKQHFPPRTPECGLATR